MPPKKKANARAARQATELARLGMSGGRVPRTLSYSGVGFPSEFITNLVYVGTVVHNDASADFDIWKQNSVFDPTVSVSTTQPMFYDQFTAIYQAYQVLATTVEMQVSVATATADVPIVLAYAWTDEGTAPAAVDTLATYRFSESRMVSAFTGGAPNYVIKTTMSSAMLHGYPDVRQVESLAAAYNADPADLGYFMVGTVPADGATAIERFVRVKITYHVRFFNLFTPAPS